MKNYTDVTILVDRSGSMQSIKDDMEGAFDSFIRSQAGVTSDECLVSLYQFDTSCDNVFTNRPVGVVPGLKIVPRGMTALYDAMEHVIEETGRRLARMPESERPQRVVFVTITDGQENSSHKSNSSKVKELLNRQQTQYNWQFVYLGANQDAMLEGGRFGLSGDYTMNYTADSKGVNTAWSTVSDTLTAYRCMASSNMSFVGKKAEDSGDREASKYKFTSSLSADPLLKED